MKFILNLLISITVFFANPESIRAQDNFSGTWQVNSSSELMFVDTTYSLSYLGEPTGLIYSIDYISSNKNIQLNEKWEFTSNRLTIFTFEDENIVNEANYEYQFTESGLKISNEKTIKLLHIPDLSTTEFSILRKSEEVTYLINFTKILK